MLPEGSASPGGPRVLRFITGILALTLLSGPAAAGPTPAQLSADWSAHAAARQGCARIGKDGRYFVGFTPSQVAAA